MATARQSRIGTGAMTTVVDFAPLFQWLSGRLPARVWRPRDICQSSVWSYIGHARVVQLTAGAGEAILET